MTVYDIMKYFFERVNTRIYFAIAFFPLMLFTRSMFAWAHSTTFTAQAYGAGTYSCGAYQEGCTTSGSVTPSAPTTGTFLSEPSFVVPGSLILAILIALATTSIARFVRRRKFQR
jgi:multisubunit Na+/H+ antiporter MnhC subunit